MLSIIIVNYNTAQITFNCLKSLYRIRNEVSFEVIVVDNGSTDNSLEKFKKFSGWIRLIKLPKNLGFSKGNNMARKHVKGDTVLFLNSDTIVRKTAIKKTLEFLLSHAKVAAVTCKLVLPDGKLDKDTRRSFPTPWVAFTHTILKIDRVFPKSPIFSRYWYGYISEDAVHEVDVIQGAFFMVKKNIIDKVGWFDEQYFLDGEDIDLCWKIKELGYKLYYYPKVSITHLKKASKRKGTKAERIIHTTAGLDSMQIFYKKYLMNKNHLLLNYIILLGIRIIRILRLAKLYFQR